MKRNKNWGFVTLVTISVLLGSGLLADAAFAAEGPHAGYIYVFYEDTSAGQGTWACPIAEVWLVSDTNYDIDDNCKTSPGGRSYAHAHADDDFPLYWCRALRLRLPGKARA